MLSTQNKVQINKLKNEMTKYLYACLGLCSVLELLSESVIAINFCAHDFGVCCVDLIYEREVSREYMQI